MNERACVYTALFGGYEDLLEQPTARDSSIDFFCFTDDPELTSDTWSVCLVDPVIATDPARSSRYPKICPHRFLPQFDMSLYIDNSVLLTRRPEEVLSALLPREAGFAALQHSFRETVLDEFAEVKRLRYDADWVCDEQLDHYRRAHPQVLSMRPLWGGLLARRHMNPEVVKAMELWWFHVLRFSRRDQLSLLAALAVSGLQPVSSAVDIRDSGSWRWPESTGRNRSRSTIVPVPPRRDEKETSCGGIERTGASEDRRQDLSLRDREMTRLKRTNADLRRQLEDVRRSKSWRWTAGLRGFYAAVRGLRDRHLHGTGRDQ